MPRFVKVNKDGQIFYRPNHLMKAIHKCFLRLICESLVENNVGREFISGNYYRQNRLFCVAKHRFNRFFYQTDIRHFFDSISCQKMANIIYQLSLNRWEKSEKEVFLFLQKYFFHKNGGLIIGANASPFLANFYAFCKIDMALLEICKEYNITYTRYVDDLIFSSDMLIGKKKRKKIRSIIIEANLKVNHGKSRVFDLKKRKTEQFFGVGIEFGGRVFVPRKIKRKVRGMIRKTEGIFGYISYDILHGNCSLLREINNSFHEVSEGEKRLHEKYLNLLKQLRLKRGGQLE